MEEQHEKRRGAERGKKKVVEEEARRRRGEKLNRSAIAVFLLVSQPITRRHCLRQCRCSIQRKASTFHTCPPILLPSPPAAPHSSIRPTPCRCTAIVVYRPIPLAGKLDLPVPSFHFSVAFSPDPSRSSWRGVSRQGRLFQQSPAKEKKN